MTVENQKHHPSISHVLQFFECGHLPEALQVWPERYRVLAQSVVDAGTGPEVVVALRHLLESKDCIVVAELGVRRNPCDRVEVPHHMFASGHHASHVIPLLQAFEVLSDAMAEKAYYVGGPDWAAQALMHLWQAKNAAVRAAYAKAQEATK